MFNYAFENLEVWQESRKLAKAIYQITASFPKSEAFGLVNQVRRAAVSVCSNIAEGSARTSSKDQAYFYQISYSSLMEVLCQLIISSDLSYLSESDYQENRRSIDKIARQISKLRSSALARIEKKN
ncbi:MAG: four helix bundle protein [Candidatus Cloacimonadaceae bacterium]|jgi:four helix bundle protein|nr:four helix bundle protein [Candidatus Cloacimonadaceae bacterium]